MSDSQDLKEDNAVKLLKAFSPELFQGRDVQKIQKFLCPVSLVEADVEEYLIDEYDSVELLVLRLYEASIHDPGVISLMTGIDREMIEKILYTETYTYRHIDAQTGALTATGEKTLQVNENLDAEDLIQHGIYDTKRELQVEAVTGTLIRGEAELRKMRKWDYSVKNMILPKEKTVIEETLEREIRNRLQAYIEVEGMFKEGSTIHNIGNLQTKSVRYRDAFCVIMEDFTYPFVAVIHNQKGTDGKTSVIVRPTAIAARDAQKIGEDRIAGKYLVRSNENFNYLMEIKDDIFKETRIAGDFEEEDEDDED